MFKIGDKVRIKPQVDVQKYEDSAIGWGEFNMPKCLNQIGTVVGFYDECTDFPDVAVDTLDILYARFYWFASDLELINE